MNFKQVEKIQSVALFCWLIHIMAKAQSNVASSLRSQWKKTCRRRWVNYLIRLKNPDTKMFNIIWKRRIASFSSCWTTRDHAQNNSTIDFSSTSTSHSFVHIFFILLTYEGSGSYNTLYVVRRSGAKGCLDYRFHAPPAYTAQLIANSTSTQSHN